MRVAHIDGLIFSQFVAQAKVWKNLVVLARKAAGRAVFVGGAGVLGADGEGHQTSSINRSWRLGGAVGGERVALIAEVRHIALEVRRTNTGIDQQLVGEITRAIFNGELVQVGNRGPVAATQDGAIAQTDRVTEAVLTTEHVGWITSGIERHGLTGLTVNTVVIGVGQANIAGV